MVITAPNITRRAGERATRAEAGVEAEGAGAEVGVGVEVGVEEAGEGGVAAGEYGSQVNVLNNQKNILTTTAGAEAGVEEGAAAEGEVTVEEAEAEVVEEVGAGVEVGGGAADMIRIAETQTDTMIEPFAFVIVFSFREVVKQGTGHFNFELYCKSFICVSSTHCNVILPVVRG